MSIHIHRWTNWRLVNGTLSGQPGHWQERHCERCGKYQTAPY